MVQIRRASRQQVKIKMAFEGSSGSGKTMSALKVAKGLCGNWEKVIVIDTENRSSELYAHLGEFSVIELVPPFSPERFIEAIKAATGAGFEVIIIDSASAEWIGKGGIIDIHGGMAGNSFTNWGKVTPRHQAFIDEILQCNAHIICNLRTKTDYVLVEKNGRQVPEKVGMKPETRDNMDYELTIVFSMDKNNSASASKDRTNLFYNKPQFVPSEETGLTIKQWCESGVDAEALLKAEKEKAMKEFKVAVKKCNSQADLVALYNKDRVVIDTNPNMQKVMADRRTEINKTAETKSADPKPAQTTDEQAK